MRIPIPKEVLRLALFIAIYWKWEGDKGSKPVRLRDIRFTPYVDPKEWSVRFLNLTGWSKTAVREVALLLENSRNKYCLEVKT